ncbi:PD-(D/E)XK nuclease family protein [Parabacteroides sp. PF5-9]|uniref:PD-(D/E)XK nuclease family protein n=1 Tax=Parabacteroides sp. PF5-9 TaxID=1742404 RepID=UPI002475F42C|nr:PD-(D/E)XK nuclease family protein [Parabacteroides sp. PF5-9]MDH6358744.1 CRISPR/Cas system-associated exonuclease Cas4 (RecB family) [Parabacteroides sp. PF5-9]
MIPFLYQIADLFYRTYGADISRLAFVFPNRRAGLFFKKYLTEIADRPLFSPTIITISDLFVELSDKQVADRISMLVTLYEIYIRKSHSAESFDEFLYWGEMLLNDFDDVDKYMADARMLFTNVTDLKTIDTDFTFLTEKQIAAIRSFWSSFNPMAISVNQQEFLAVWQILYELYQELKQALAVQGKGYEGMIFREVVENIRETSDIRLPYDKVVFVGLNALSVVEEGLLLRLSQLGMADFYWDYASKKVTDPENKASFFVQRNMTLFPSLYELSPEEPVETAIEVIGIPSGVGQAKHIYTLLEEYAKEQPLEGETALRTAVILPDENMLMPVLNAIPPEIDHINVTMGYPLSHTPVALLMNDILTLQKNIRYVDRIPQFYYRDVLPILNHRYMKAIAPESVQPLISDITRFNKIYISQEELSTTPLLALIFTPVIEANELSDYLVSLLTGINGQLNRLKNESVPQNDTEQEQSVTPQVRDFDLDQEFIFHYFTTVNRLKEVIREHRVEMRPETYFRLLRRMTDLITIPFEGEPLSGLQVMGVLETRALDFDRIIILSMNEGIFPLRKAASSFIPYNLRRGFGLPTYEHQDSVWAYHFYRLIHRASHVSLIYDTRTTGLQTGEVSRYVHQLHYHYKEPVRNKLLIYNVSSTKTPAIEIIKNDEILRRLDDLREGGTYALSASAINTYLDCPLKFYFSVIEGVKEEEEVSETIESSVFGSILHKVLEELYKPLKGQLITADILELIRKDQHLITEKITMAFAREFFKTERLRPLTGQNYLIGEMIRKYVVKVFSRDGKLTPFRYLESEKRITTLFTLTDGSVIPLKGFIDRIDEVDGTIRIVDYKSGLGDLVFDDIPALFDQSAKDRAKAVMQVFMYAWMYVQETPSDRPIRPAIYYMRRLFADPFETTVQQRVERKKLPIDDFREYMDEFETGLRTCLDEIFSRETSFIQTPTGKACTYCDFKGICGK